MARIFISHSHTDEAIAHKLFDFLIAALKLDDEDILCTSDPNSGLSFNSNTISDQLKSNLKGADALVALITGDSLRSLWIPFEIGSFWPTEKTIVLILGPGLKPAELPGPLKGWLSISIENDQAFEQLNQMINQLEAQLEILQNSNRSRRDRYLREFITRFKAWESKSSPNDGSLQKQVAELSKQLQDQEETYEAKIQQIERKLDEKSLVVEQFEAMKAIAQQDKNELARSQATKQIKELRVDHQEQIEKVNEVNKPQNIVQSISSQDFIEDLRNGIKLEMVVIPGGTFLMGSPEGEGEDNEKPQHKVTLQPFLMSKYPITQVQYRQLMGSNPSFFEDEELRPVDTISWDDATKFCQKLSKLVGKEYRLPTEAEWEYACRAGTNTAFYFGESVTDELVNCDETVGKTTSVGNYPPNAFGLYDMHGNIWEWCQDNWHVDYQGASNDGSVWISEKSIRHVIRGGSWYDAPALCRSAYRLNYMHNARYNNISFRVICTTLRTT